MGVVFKARDHKYDGTNIERIVALKTIRPDLDDREQIELRFKREIHLSQQIGHRNVIKVFELLEAAGVPFVVMEFIDGQDLKQVLASRGKLPYAEASAIIRQAALAIGEVHARSIIHRDLKPANFMLANDGRVVLMDFGLAKSTEGDKTETVAMAGTAAYMSPEQVAGQGRLDPGTDIYSLGLIFYELLTGRRPFASESVVAEASARLQGSAPSARAADSSIPESLSNIVARCLDLDRSKRFKSAEELIAALDGYSIAIPSRPRLTRRLALPVAVLGAAAVIAIPTWLFMRQPAVPAPRSPVSVLVADFENATTEPIFDGALEQMFTIALEDASFVNAFPRVQAAKIAHDIDTGATKLTEAVARSVAAREGIALVVGGRIERAGSGYGLKVRAVEGLSGRIVLESADTARTKDDALRTGIRLATSLRKALGDHTADSVEARAETFTAASIGAMQAYALGQQRMLEGKFDQAIAEYNRALQMDPQMGRAYSGLATAYHNLKNWNAAEENFRKALGQLDRMTERERYRTRGGYYIHRENPDKAIEEFTALVEKYPADNAGFGNLALAYFGRREMKLALTYGRKALELYPASAMQRNNVALYALYSGDFDTAETEATEASRRNPNYPLATVAIGLSQVGRGRYAEAKQTYARLKTLGRQGEQYGGLGLFDLAMLESRPKDALSAVKTLPATELADISSAEALWADGNAPAASARAESVAKTAKSVHALLRAGNLLIKAGKPDAARQIAEALTRDATRVRKAYGLILSAEVAIAQRQFEQAIDDLDRSKNLEDAWWGRWASARAWYGQGRLPEAHSDLDECVRRSGEALAAFLDDIPTARFMSAVLDLRHTVESQLKQSAAAVAAQRR